MEQLGVVAGNFALSFSLIFLGIFVHISGSTRPITLIWESLKGYFPPAEVEERPRLVTRGSGVNGLTKVCVCIQGKQPIKLEF